MSEQTRYVWLLDIARWAKCLEHGVTESDLSWGHGYYGYAGQQPGEPQLPRWRLITPKGAQFFAPCERVARKGDIVLPILAGLDACRETDAEAQRRVLQGLYERSKK